MRRGRRRLITVAESIKLWRMYKAGESIQGIGRALSRTGSSVNRVLQSTGGIVPAERLRSLRVLSLAERLKTATQRTRSYACHTRRFIEVCSCRPVAY
jgi:hypothetical protein